MRRPWTNPAKLRDYRNTRLYRPLARTLRVYNRRLLDGLRARGFTDFSSAFPALLSNLDLEGTRIGVLAKRAGITRQAAGQLLREIEKCGYVERRAAADDARATIVRFTAPWPPVACRRLRPCRSDRGGIRGAPWRRASSNSFALHSCGWPIASIRSASSGCVTSLRGDRERHADRTIRRDEDSKVESDDRPPSDSFTRSLCSSYRSVLLLRLSASAPSILHVRPWRLG